MTNQEITPYIPHGQDNGHDDFVRVDDDGYDTLATTSPHNHNQNQNDNSPSVNDSNAIVTTNNPNTVTPPYATTTTTTTTTTPSPEQGYSPQQDPVPTATATMNEDKKLRHQTPHEYFEEDPMNRKIRWLKRRHKRVYMSGAGGSIVGGIFLGPPGLFLGAIAGGVIATRVSKRKERAKDRRMEEMYATYYYQHHQHQVDPVQAKVGSTYPVESEDLPQASV